MIDYLPLVLTGIGIIISILYYTSVLRNANRTRELQLKSQEHAEETRKIQLMLEINQFIQDINQTDFDSILNLEWTNISDFFSKYGSEANPTIHNIRVRIWRNMNVSGLLVRDGLIDISSYVDYNSALASIMWYKYKPIIEELRRMYDSPSLYYGIEYLAQEIDKYRINQGLKPLVSVGQRQGY